VYNPSQSLEVHPVKQGELVKSSMMDKCKSPKSHLAPPGSLVKRSREDGASDLELGIEKKMKGDECSKPNLTKSKSKSMMNINGKKSQVSKAEFEDSHSKVKVPLPITAGNQRRQTSVLNVGTNVSHNRSVFEHQKIAGKKSSGNGKAKRPAWDLKGRLEDMELMFDKTNKRILDLEEEKHTLQKDVDMKKEVVAQSSDEIKKLRCDIDISEKELDVLRNSLQCKEDQFKVDVHKLCTELEDEKFVKSGLERKLKSLEDELSCKQTEIRGLKQSIAELGSSRACLESNLAGAKLELEAAVKQTSSLKAECEDKSAQIIKGLEEQEKLNIKLRWEESERRKLHNIVQELKGNIRVFCRLRPMLDDERSECSGRDAEHINILSENNVELIKTVDTDASDSVASGLNKNMKYEFEFDRVFGPSCTQSDVFTEISQLVQSALDGYNVCVFAYGQTGSGKTYTMEGGLGLEVESESGMIPRTVKQIFDMKRRLKDKNWDYKLQASFLEIYNEEIRDLLANDPNLRHEIKMNESKDVTVTNLKVEEVVSEEQINKMIFKARKNRSWAKTLCNERSSRSHSVFLLRIEGFNTSTLEKCCSTLNLVDLAGSERVKDSGSEGMRLIEAQAINKSLSNLGNVIMALAQKSSHVPYRNSKLTYLLQNCLGGNSKTLMFVNISPIEICFNETLSSLRFATKVNQCNIGMASKKVGK